MASYWENTGKYQQLTDKLEKLIPHEGSVANPETNKALEKFRIASNCYYDLFNNGLCNRAKEFRKVFKMAGTKLIKDGILKDGIQNSELESKMDTIIVEAAIEQDIIKVGEPCNK